MIAESDARLVQRTLEGDSSAFGRLFVRYRDQVYRTAMAVTGNEEDAWDAVQDSFLLAFRKLGNLRHQDRFSWWLGRITRRAAVAPFRRTHASCSLDQVSAHGGEPADSRLRPDEIAELRECHTRLRDSLAYLSPVHRGVVELQLLGHQNSVIAQMLNLPAGTVKSRLHRLRRELRELLGESVANAYRV